jgi:predicted DNA-binding transcriptional regulator YafY
VPRRSERDLQGDRQKKELVLLQLALVLMSGGELSYRRLTDEFLLPRRTAERYLKDLREAGLPIASRRDGREAVFFLDELRSRALDLEAIDIPPAAARSLSLLLVAAALLPAKLGVRDAVDRTVRAALRLRGMRAASEMKRFEDAVLVLENDAKDYEGKADVFGALIDACLAGELLEVRYRTPRLLGEQLERFYCASIGLYRGGLYALAVAEGDDGTRPVWRAVERIQAEPVAFPDAPLLTVEARLRALDEAGRRWGPARPREGEADDEQVITLHFSARAAPYVLARPWHPRADVEAWPEEEGGGARMAIRLSGQTMMFESWVRSWGPEVQVLRPRDMAERLASSFEDAARAHREAAARFERDLLGDD